MVSLRYACLLARDIQRLARFYTAVLQAEPQWNGQSYAEFPSDSDTLCLWALDAYALATSGKALPDRCTGAVMLEFEVADVDAEFRRLNRLADWAIEFVVTPTTMTWGNRSIYLRDPEGNLVNLLTRLI